MLGIKLGPSWVGREQGKYPDAVLQSSHFFNVSFVLGSVGDHRGNPDQTFPVVYRSGPTFFFVLETSGVWQQ